MMVSNILVMLQNKSALLLVAYARSPMKVVFTKVDQSVRAFSTISNSQYSVEGQFIDAPRTPGHKTVHSAAAKINVVIFFIAARTSENDSKRNKEQMQDLCFLGRFQQSLVCSNCRMLNERAREEGRIFHGAWNLNVV